MAFDDYIIYKRTGMIFWDEYVCESFPRINDVNLAIIKCMDDFESSLNKNLNKWNCKVKLIPKRGKKLRKN